MCGRVCDVDTVYVTSCCGLILLQGPHFVCCALNQIYDSGVFVDPTYRERTFSSVYICIWGRPRYCLYNYKPRFMSSALKKNPDPLLLLLF